MSSPINNLNELTKQYDTLVNKKHNKEDNLYLRKKKDGSVSLEAHNWGIFSRLKRKWKSDEYTFEPTATKVSDICASSLQEMNKPENQIKQLEDLNVLDSFTQWFDARIDKYQNKTKNPNAEKIISQKVCSQALEKMKNLRVNVTQVSREKNFQISLCFIQIVRHKELIQEISKKFHDSGLSTIADKWKETIYDPDNTMLQQSLGQEVTTIIKEHIEKTQTLLSSFLDLEKAQESEKKFFTKIKTDLEEFQSKLTKITINPDDTADVLLEKMESMRLLKKKVEDLCTQYQQELPKADLISELFKSRETQPLSLQLAELFWSPIDSGSEGKGDILSRCKQSTNEVLEKFLEKTKYITDNIDADKKVFKGCQEYAGLETELTSLREDITRLQHTIATSQDPFSLENIGKLNDCAGRIYKAHDQWDQIDVELRIPKECGTISVTVTKDNVTSTRTLTILKQIDSSVTCTFLACDPDTKQTIGKIGIHFEIPGDNTNWTKKFSQNPPLVVIDLVRGTEPIQERLLQLAMEEGYLRGCEGRLVIEARDDSHLFYYNQGLRSDIPEINDELAKAAKTETKQKYLPTTVMRLTDEAIAEWKKRITKQPILTQQKAPE
jgi:hypothetical protein